MEKSIKVNTRKIDFLCPKCNNGFLRNNGLVFTSNPPQYPHQCNNTSCNYKQTFAKQYPYIEYDDNPSIIDIVFDTSKKIEDNRTQYHVLASLMEEVGELALEIKIANGNSYKEAGSDGIIGESIDVINCALDLIYVTNPNITEEQIMEIMRTKCDKWHNNYLKQNNGKD